MAASSKYTIYALTDKAGDVRYVGWTVNTQRRLRLHLAEAKRQPLKTHRTRWVGSLLREGLTPGLVVIETGTGCDWAEKERGWIAFFRELGCKLTNGTTGGDGTPGHVVSAESRAKLREYRLKQTMPPISPETRAKLSAYRAAHPMGPISPETRAKLSVASRRRKASPETRAKHSEVQRKRWAAGRTVSPETRVKMSESHRRRWVARKAA